ncbi:AAA family ATPase [Brachybacterium sp. GU-2]|uniref:AAA family ATPase n=1 Tax=Brachybacterium sp. GU-2 TaxID=3069708 RepID=UPI00298D58AB|nr:AAA family ATPase [Brachybacterium sp. GU-2]WME22111.2 AAA family ATPase [Brachybacterium sp. GU-2]
MKIIELRAENVKRLKAVGIHPDGTLQVIGGRNAQGKSSVLDAIWLALGGGKAGKSTAVPIRDGEDNASVTLDLGNLIVTRSWTKGGTTLKVTSADGAAYSSPQKMLDALVGQLTFDPLEFTRLSARDQRDALLDLVDLPVDIDSLDQKRASLFAERTAIGQQGKAIGEVAVDTTLPEQETSMSEAVAALRDAERRSDEGLQVRADLEAAERTVEQLRESLAKAEANVVASKAAVEQLETAPDPAPLAARLETLEEENQRIRANNAAREKAAERDRLRGAYSDLTEQIDALDTEKQQALAEASFPVDGLGFDEHGVTYAGVPFSQASSAEQIRVSLAMAMAANPKLRVIRILDGSLLDDDAMVAIREQVAERDFQLWIERVGDADEGAVVIEDGEVR